ncbi:MAG: 23S rRNA (uracil(1939)-C(5))-methyltransferase RlmD [Clostridia bacterium]|nr:23S rRNA (uracil(1939)-C(5))-methyltransferase RlmD [Clostridia bacterium]
METGGCPHFGQCGGCAFGNESYEEQLALKEEETLKLFRPLLPESFFSGGAYEGAIESPRRFGYRNKMEYTFGNDRKDGPLRLGMHRKGRFFDIVEVPGCRIVPADMDRVRGAVQDYFAEAGVPFYHKMSHRGILRYLIVRRSESDGSLLVNLVTASGYEPGEEFVRMLLGLPLEGRITGILHTVSDSLSDAVVPETVRTLFGEPYLAEELLGLRFRLSAFSFFQTNTSCAAKLYEKAREYVGEVSGQTVFDLYSGTGTIAQMLAAAAKEVIGIEIVPEAVEAARDNAALNGLANCRFVCGDVLKAVDETGVVPDLVVADPPRDGVNPKALSKILRFGAKRIVYVSCKPSSLARDIPAMRLAGYEPKRLALADMFPFTKNIEAVCLFEQETAGMN